MAVEVDQQEGRPAAVFWALLIGLSTFSFSPILVRFAQDAPGMTIAVWRTVIATVALAPFALLRARKEMHAFNRRDYVMIGGGGIFLGLHFSTWIESLYHTSVASASVLVTTSPIFLAVLGYLFLKERLSPQVNLAIVLAVVGAALIGFGDLADAGGSDPLFGNSLALGSALLFSVYILVGRVARRKTSWIAYVFPLYTMTALTILVIALVLDTPLFGFSPGFYALCAAMAIGPQIIGHGSFNYAVRYVPAAMLGLLSLIEPIGASILAYILFDEIPTVLAIGGMFIVLSAISFAVLYRRRRAVDVHTD